MRRWRWTDYILHAIILPVKEAKPSGGSGEEGRLSVPDEERAAHSTRAQWRIERRVL